jgi:hypothetical protein
LSAALETEGFHRRRERWLRAAARFLGSFFAARQRMNVKAYPRPRAARHRRGALWSCKAANKPKTIDIYKFFQLFSPYPLTLSL